MISSSAKNNTIFFADEPVAVYLNIEYEYYKDNKTIEISVQRLNGGVDKMTDNIVNYIRKRHPEAKIEVKIPEEWNID